jgi:hypothetical protein
MTPPSTGEVMEALNVAETRTQIALDQIGHLLDEEGRAKLRRQLRVLAFLAEYAPEICSRAEKEAQDIREVRVVLTVEEARLLQDSLPKVGAEVFWLLVPGMRSCVEKLDSALRDLDEPASLVEAKKEENNE